MSAHHPAWRKVIIWLITMPHWILFSGYWECNWTEDRRVSSNSQVLRFQNISIIMQIILVRNWNICIKITGRVYELLTNSEKTRTSSSFDENEERSLYSRFPVTRGHDPNMFHELGFQVLQARNRVIATLDLNSNTCWKFKYQNKAVADKNSSFEI